MFQRTFRGASVAGLLAMAASFGCAPATAQLPVPATSTSAATATTDVDTLVAQHFASVNELDPAKRRERMASVYTPDVLLVEPYGTMRGPDELAASFGSLLQDRFPGASIRRDGELQRRESLVRARWALGKPDAPPLHTGEDIFLIDAGRIRAIYVFVDEDAP
jgi:hypothetical protein